MTTETHMYKLDTWKIIHPPPQSASRSSFELLWILLASSLQLLLQLPWIPLVGRLLFLLVCGEWQGSTSTGWFESASSGVLSLSSGVPVRPLSCCCSWHHSCEVMGDLSRVWTRRGALSSCSSLWVGINHLINWGSSVHCTSALTGRATSV